MQKLFIILLMMTAGIFFIANCLAAADDSATPEQIAKWRAASEEGDAHAEYLLGSAYQKGEGVAQDDVAAASWFAKAAEQGDTDAQFSLGFAYRGGFGVQRDNVTAYMWFDIAAARGNSQAANMRSAVAELMNYDDIEKARKLAKEWKPAIR